MLLATSYIVCFVTREDDEQAPAEAENDGVIMRWEMFVGKMEHASTS